MSMTIRDATPDDLQLDPVRRSKFSFQDMAGIVTSQDNDESLVGTEALLDAGFLVAPFWETPGDTEGACYASYVAEHPGFELSVREGVFSRLKDASRQLPRNWQIVLKAGFRPYEVQIAVLDAFIHASHMRHPDWRDARHLMQARTFVADPRIVCPPHVTGGAVDIDVKDKRTGEYIDMGCPPNTDNEISYLHSDLVTPEQHENRMILLRAMLAADFAPNPHEWWHYQYGETYWAAFYGHQTTLYGLIKV